MAEFKRIPLSEAIAFSLNARTPKADLKRAMRPFQGTPHAPSVPGQEYSVQRQLDEMGLELRESILRQVPLHLTARRELEGEIVEYRQRLGIQSDPSPMAGGAEDDQKSETKDPRAQLRDAYKSFVTEARPDLQSDQVEKLTIELMDLTDTWVRSLSTNPKPL